MRSLSLGLLFLAYLASFSAGGCSNAGTTTDQGAFNAGFACRGAALGGACSASGTFCPLAPCAGGSTTVLACSDGVWTGTFPTKCSSDGAVVCPPFEPSDGEACGPANTSCAYTAPDCPPGATDTATCTTAGWSVALTQCDPPPFVDAGSDGGADACSHAVSNAPCAVEGVVCDFAVCVGGTAQALRCGSSRWQSFALACDADAGACPIDEPRNGDSCATVAQTCAYLPTSGCPTATADRVTCTSLGWIVTLGAQCDPPLPVTCGDASASADAARCD